MAIKTNGKEFKEFYTDETIWQDGVYHDDTIILVDGVEDDSSMDLLAISDTAKVVIECGIILPEGKDMLSVFRSWRKKQTHTSILLTVDKSQVDSVKNVLSTAGIKFTIS